jgi:hypothetical protein
MKVRENGNEHSVGEQNCQACQSPEGEQFPQLHADGVVVCPGLVHAEIVAGDQNPAASEAVIYRCDVCGESI